MPYSSSVLMHKAPLTILSHSVPHIRHYNTHHYYIIITSLGRVPDARPRTSARPAKPTDDDFDDVELGDDLLPE